MHSNESPLKGKTIKDTGTVRAQKEIAPGIFKLEISTAAAALARPGQFVSLYSRDKSRLLPRPISICDMDKKAGSLTLVYRVAGAGTDEFSKLSCGDQISLIGPLGNGYDLPDDRTDTKQGEYKLPDEPVIIAIGGGIGIPPVLGLAKHTKAGVQAVLGYRDANLFLKEEFESAGAAVHIATDDGSVGTHGTVIDAIKEQKVEGNVIYACGPMPMLRAVKKYAEDNGILCFLSLEERMACGVGACLGCITKTSHKDEHSQVDNMRVCTEGPVFLSTEVLM